MNKQELNTSNIKLYNNLFDISERKQLISETLFSLRKSFGLTQSEVANYLGIKSGTYSTYESGSREAPAEIIVRLSLLYNIPTDYILQAQRFSKNSYIRRQQLDNLDDELNELEDILSEKGDEMDSVTKEFFTAFTNSLAEMNKNLAEFIGKQKIDID